MSCTRPVLLIFLFLFSLTLYGQLPQKDFNPNSFPANYFVQLKKEFGAKKQYPPEFEKQILIALSYYPDLANTPILFRKRIRHTPANTSVTLAGLFESAKARHYVITISDSTEGMLLPILFKNLPFNAQVGVIGHELAHVADPSTQRFLQIMKHVISSISARHVDRVEFNTDARCIAHGLGYQLLSWSTFVRMQMKTTNWEGADYAHRPKMHERYMNPATIRKRIEDNSMYKTIL